MAEELAVTPAIEPKYLAVSADQKTLARQTIARDLNQHEFDLFVYNCRRQGVHPLDNMLIPVVRTDNGVRKLTFTTTVDLLRSRAAETNDYAGSDDVVFEENTPYPKAATMTVWRIVQGLRCPFTATARWDEYFPGGKQGFMWTNKPHVMLGKCAEALALRKAFPKQLAGMYATEELQRYEEPPQRKSKVAHAELPANISAMSVSPEPNRGHSDTGMGRVPEQVAPKDDVMCAECQVVNGHKADCQYAKSEQDRKTSKPTTKALYTILGIEERKTKAKAQYLLLDVLNNENVRGKLYVWHKSLFEFILPSKGKQLLCEVSTEEKDGKVFVSLEHIIEVSGVTFVNDKPAVTGEMPAESEGVDLEFDE